MKTALIVGATGLVGKELVRLLTVDGHYAKVVVFTRRSTGVKHPKLVEHLVDFTALDSWKDLLRGDTLFSTLGTTIKKAGSQQAQYQIDYTYQYSVARAAAENGVSRYVLVSSAGAASSSRLFYSRMKGELEEAVQELPFEYIRIIRPGILAGDREEFRLGERIGIGVLTVLRFVPGLSAYRPIQASIVARAMIKASLIEGDRVRRYTLKEVFTLGNGKL